MVTPLNLDASIRENRDWAELVREVWHRFDSVEPGRWQASLGFGAAVAAEAYRLTDQLSPGVVNSVSELWRQHLELVWEYLEGDAQRHYALSAAVAEHLTGPLNHLPAGPGPEEFDQPQIRAGYGAALALVTGSAELALRSVWELPACIYRAYGWDADAAGERREALRRQSVKVRTWTSWLTEFTGHPSLLYAPHRMAEFRRLGVE